MERRRFLIVKRRVKGQPPLAGIFKGEQPLKGKPRPPAPIKNQPVYWRFFPGLCGSASVQHAEPSLAETRCIANKLLYRKISHCLVHSLKKRTMYKVHHGSCMREKYRLTSAHSNSNNRSCCFRSRKRKRFW